MKQNLPRLSKAPITDLNRIESLGYTSGLKPVTDPDKISSVEKFSQHQAPAVKSNELYGLLKNMLE